MTSPWPRPERRPSTPASPAPLTCGASPPTPSTTLTASLRLSGALDLADAGTITSGQLAIAHEGGPIGWVRGTITIPGIHRGSATIRIDVEQLFGRHVGRITVQDPGAHFAFTALFVTATLVPTSAGQVSGTDGPLAWSFGGGWARNHDRRPRRGEGGRQHRPTWPRDDASHQLTFTL